METVGKMDTIDTPPQPPQKSHTKRVTIVSTRERTSEDFDVQIQDGRTKKMKLNTSTSKGRNVRGIVELVPKPSRSCADPLNWSALRKNFAFGSLMLGVAMIGSLKTMLVTVNAVIATEFSVSYMAATALTGVPLIIGAFAAIGSQILSTFIGKKGIYLGSSVLLLIAALGNMRVFGSYGAFMVTRCLQGLAWGSFEGLVASSIDDLFFVHERQMRRNIYNTVNFFFLWGTPILGGYLSQSTDGFRNQIMVINIVEAFSIVLLVFATPETSFDRSSLSAASTTPPSGSPMKLYLSTLRLKTPHSTRKFNSRQALQPLKAIYAPSAIMTTFLTAPLLATAFGIAHSVSLLFSAMPTFLFPSHLGYLFILPLAFTLLLSTLFTYISYLRSKPPNHLSHSREVSLATPALVIGVVGLIGLGLYVAGALMVISEAEGADGTVFMVSVTGAELSLKTVSALFGLLVAGAVVLESLGSKHILSSSPMNYGGDIDRAKNMLTEVFMGIWVIAMPLWIEGNDTMGMIMGLRATAIALGVVCIVVGSSAGALMWTRGERIENLDRRVLGVRGGEDGAEGSKMRPLRKWDSKGSFFEA